MLIEESSFTDGEGVYVDIISLQTKSSQAGHRVSNAVISPKRVTFNSSNHWSSIANKIFLLQAFCKAKQAPTRTNYEKISDFLQ